MKNTIVYHGVGINQSSLKFAINYIVVVFRVQFKQMSAQNISQRTYPTYTACNIEEKLVINLFLIINRIY